jgi:hypothetical protein
MNLLKKFLILILFVILYTKLPYLTLPVSSAYAERSFSSLKRLKTYLRSTKFQERLFALAILNTEKYLL